jgi:hypothetical protein
VVTIRKIRTVLLARWGHPAGIFFGFEWPT